ncbi:hypothetical protein [Candidatus Pelagibacter bacterium nBUS_29]|uniref:hypothetical protein n=1 Tax=Candidatus Pelagibacter bacterium nBUS_29 TaxID=3374190 RepID=UPI003EB73A23
MYKILLVGAGQIGSRYLEGLAKLNINFELIVIEPNLDSLNTAKSRWTSACIEGRNYNIKWSNRVQPQKYEMDLAIISTSSVERCNIVKNVSETFSPKFWIMEKLLAQSKKEIDLIIKATDKSHGAWVNIPRRLDTWHKRIASEFNFKGPIKVIKTGGLWGMACNSIHLIDLVCWWTGEKILSIDTDKLDKNWIKSKREGYFEITGEMIAKFSNGSSLILRSNENFDYEFIKVYLRDNKEIVINENEGFLISPNGKKSNGSLQLQSELTAPLIKKLILENNCELPTLNISAQQHSVFINSMLKHWNVSQKLADSKVPIT